MQLDFPCHFSFLLHYPFMIHENRTSSGSNASLQNIDWIANSDGIITSKICTRMVEPCLDLSTDNGCNDITNYCQPCERLIHNPKLKNVLKIAIDASNGTSPSRSNDMYAPMSEFIKKRNTLNHQIDSLKLDRLQQGRKTGLLSRK